MSRKRKRVFIPPMQPYGVPYGYQPPARHGSTGSLRWHAGGCAVNGGQGLPRGACKKCAESVDRQFYQALMRQENRKRKVDVRD